MLVLTRKPSQSFTLSGGITVTVLSMIRNQVKLGIEAPKDVVILRTELKEKKK